MQPHVNFGIRYRTHFETIGVSPARNRENYNKAIGRIKMYYRTLRLKKSDMEEKISELRRKLNLNIRIDPFAQ